jgi:hypothetical protein
MLVMAAVLLFAPTNRPSAATEMLLAAADQAETVAVTHTFPVEGAATDTPGIRYTKTENEAMVSISPPEGGDELFTALVPKTREMWVAPDGSGRIAETAGDPVFLSEQDRTGWERLGGLSDSAINEEFGPGGLVYEDFESLPTDPTQLEAVLGEIPHGEWPDEVGLFWSVGDLLRNGYMPAELRAALFRVAARIDGIELVGTVTDRAGRPGIAVALTYEGNGLVQQETLIFDPDTTQLLGEEHILLTESDFYRAKPPITVSWTVYLQSVLVNQVP